MTFQNPAAAAQSVVAEAAASLRAAPELDLGQFAPDVIDLDAYALFFGFGDSLADTGNASSALTFISDLTNQEFPDVTDPALGYFQERFSNGPVYFDRIAQEIVGGDGAFAAFDAVDGAPFKVELDETAATGANFAFGGAVIDAENPVTPLGDDAENSVIANFDTQVQLFEKFYVDSDTDLTEGIWPLVDGALGGFDTVDLAPGASLSDGLYAVNFGGNDLFALVDQLATADVPAFIASVVEAYRAELETLIAAGATDFLIAGAPNVGFTPTVVNGGFGGDLALSAGTVAPTVDALNGALADMLAALSDATGATFYLFNPEFDDVLADPAAFGLDPTLLTTAFTDTLTPDDLPAAPSDADSFTFLDPIHPTVTIQDQFFLQSLAAADVSGPALDALIEGDGVAMELGAEPGVAANEVIIGAEIDEIIRGRGGNDVISGGDGNDLIRGQAGDDLIVGGKGFDRLIGGRGDDVLVGDAKMDHLEGGRGRDVLSGGGANDRLEGGRARDILEGGIGNDVLNGGGAGDVFVFTGAGGAQTDVIEDFGDGADRIDVSRFRDDGLTEAQLTEILASATEVDGGARLDLGGDAIIFLEGVQTADLGLQSFIAADDVLA